LAEKVEHTFGEDTSKLLNHPTIVHPARLFMGNMAKSISPRQGALVRDHTNKVISIGKPRPTMSRNLSISEYHKIRDSS